MADLQSMVLHLGMQFIVGYKQLDYASRYCWKKPTGCGVTIGFCRDSVVPFRTELQKYMWAGEPLFTAQRQNNTIPKKSFILYVL